MDFEPEKHGWEIDLSCSDESATNWEFASPGGETGHIGEAHWTERNPRCWASVALYIADFGCVVSETWNCQTLEEAVRIVARERMRFEPVFAALKRTAERATAKACGCVGDEACRVCLFASA